MKVVNYEDVNKFEVVNIENPTLNKTLNVKIKIKYCGICGSDIHKLLYEKPNSNYVKTSVLGHEITGEVVEIADNVKSISVGDKVVIEPLLYCDECNKCKRGQIQFCLNLKSLGKDIQGGFAEYLIVNEKQVYKVNDGTKLKVATLTDPYSVAIHINSLTDNKNSKIAIIGDGIIGIATAEILSNNNQITVFGKHKNREKILQKINVDYKDIECIDQYRDYFDITIEAVGGRQADTLKQAISLCKKKGKIIVSGVYDTKFKFDISLREAFYKELQIIGCNSFEKKNGISDFKRALDFLSFESRISNDLISKIFKIDDFSKAIDYIKDRKHNECIKILVNM